MRKDRDVASQQSCVQHLQTFTGCVPSLHICVPTANGNHGVMEQVMLRPCHTLISEVLWPLGGNKKAEESPVHGSNSRGGMKVFQ